MDFKTVARWISLSAVLGAAGRHMFEDADDVDPCPLNSGYPCPCSVEATEQVGGGGDDGAHCLSDGDDFGVCSLPCTGSQTCFYTQGFGLEGLCDTLGTRTYCKVLCEDAFGNRGDCPPGMVCNPAPKQNFSICETAF